MKKVLNEAGIHDFDSHSFRGAASSAMIQSGMSIEDVLIKAGWSNAKTFKRFYYQTAPSAKVDTPMKEENKITHYFSKL